jgi:ankyrin repeat protein
MAEILNDGGDVNAKDKFGQTALMLAAMHGRGDVVQLLIGAGAKLDVTAKFGLSALMLAVVNHNDSIARDLAAADADLTLRGTGAPGFADKTAADLARDNGQTALVEYLDGIR